MLTKVHVRKHERALWFREGDFKRVLPPGTHRLWSRLWNWTDCVEKADTLRTRFDHPMLEVMLSGDSRLRDQLVVLDLNDAQRALVWRDDRLFQIVGPGKHAYWIVPAKLDVETYSVNEFNFKHPRLALVLQHPDATKWLDGVQVEDSEEVLLYRDGVLIDTLRKGLHVFWKGTGKVRWKTVDLREQVADVAGQEIMTADKVTLRVNLLVTYQVVDPLRSVSAVTDAPQALYRDAQLVLRAAVGTRPLDALLSDKESVGGEVRDSLVRRSAEYGIAVRSVGLRDIILPGDMKSLLNQVIAAQKEAEANLIKRREETAAARSQANTAKLLSENPMLARLKELEMLREMLAGTSTTFVFGGGDIADQVRSLVTAKAG